MKQRNTMLFFVLIGLSAVFWLNLKFSISDHPVTMLDLEDEQEELNEQLISAQILASKLDRVYTLFDENLAIGIADSIAEDASMPFLQNLTEMMNDLGVTLMNIKPKPREKRENYFSAPYELLLKCNFDQLGKFVAEIERSPRLITIDEFLVKNGIERVKTTTSEADLKEQIVELHLSTLTLVKSKGSSS
ncbi:MAG: type 4a pilus biogenesis protein PilO [Candidatus Marinimicrobia bacterium]|jgi:Tfp pilus assembly protein PilO|nr:type 4a pilus biogenesis protein PilO [Candidatus Neomarinimicrobiota bacterium]MBT3617500.1 type 4a pilus biogenesis protein PilO [Candidatus Neomarinimicrobiota bacterium]MBT3829440.1 type 4a pilus biogenesis protein PilO [Candidatus Neomarinimicrobiota bacterium]MBT3996978.1 type 4a pilus biogenesis protein PilO [Candidatus Neomarinimicrobiota bacterium]MBT4281104.1 type 4a pilus biogenesis protein PilO [Candidatus Neomarinimicrobiota bacterium]